MRYHFSYSGGNSVPLSPEAKRSGVWLLQQSAPGESSLTTKNHLNPRSPLQRPISPLVTSDPSFTGLSVSTRAKTPENKLPQTVFSTRRIFTDKNNKTLHLPPKPAPRSQEKSPSRLIFGSSTVRNNVHQAVPSVMPSIQYPVHEYTKVHAFEKPEVFSPSPKVADAISAEVSVHTVRTSVVPPLPSVKVGSTESAEQSNLNYDRSYYLKGSSVVPSSPPVRTDFSTGFTHPQIDPPVVSATRFEIESSRTHPIESSALERNNGLKMPDVNFSSSNNRDHSAPAVAHSVENRHHAVQNDFSTGFTHPQIDPPVVSATRFGIESSRTHPIESPALERNYGLKMPDVNFSSSNNRDHSAQAVAHSVENRHHAVQNDFSTGFTHSQIDVPVISASRFKIESSRIHPIESSAFERSYGLKMPDVNLSSSNNRDHLAVAHSVDNRHHAVQNDFSTGITHSQIGPSILSASPINIESSKTHPIESSVLERNYGLKMPDGDSLPTDVRDNTVPTVLHSVDNRHHDVQNDFSTGITHSQVDTSIVTTTPVTVKKEKTYLAPPPTLNRNYGLKRPDVNYLQTDKRDHHVPPVTHPVDNLHHAVQPQLPFRNEFPTGIPHPRVDPTIAPVTSSRIENTKTLEVEPYVLEQGSSFNRPNDGSTSAKSDGQKKYVLPFPGVITPNSNNNSRSNVLTSLPIRHDSSTEDTWASRSKSYPIAPARNGIMMVTPAEQSVHAPRDPPLPLSEVNNTDLWPHRNTDEVYSMSTGGIKSGESKMKSPNEPAKSVIEVAPEIRGVPVPTENHPENRMQTTEIGPIFSTSVNSFWTPSHEIRQNPPEHLETRMSPGLATNVIYDKTPPESSTYTMNVRSPAKQNLFISTVSIGQTPSSPVTVTSTTTPMKPNTIISPKQEKRDTTVERNIPINAEESRMFIKNPKKPTKHRPNSPPSHRKIVTVTGNIGHQSRSRAPRGDPRRNTVPNNSTLPVSASNFPQSQPIKRNKSYHEIASDDENDVKDFKNSLSNRLASIRRKKSGGRADSKNIRRLS